MTDSSHDDKTWGQMLMENSLGMGSYGMKMALSSHAKKRTATSAKKQKNESTEAGDAPEKATAGTDRKAAKLNINLAVFEDIKPSLLSYD